MRYAVLLLPLVLLGAGCVESLVESQADVLVDMAIDGAEELNEQAPGLIDASMDELFLDGIGQSNGVWLYAGNSLSSDQLAFTTSFDSYVNLSATDDETVVRVQNYDPLLDALIDGGYFLWIDVDAVVDPEFYESSYDVLEDIELGDRTWVMGSNKVGVGEAPVRGYRYDDGEQRFEISVYTNDAQGLERAETFVRTLEFVE
jgi:hypothetical protein